MNLVRFKIKMESKKNALVKNARALANSNDNEIKNSTFQVSTLLPTLCNKAVIF